MTTTAAPLPAATSLPPLRSAIRTGGLIGLGAVAILASLSDRLADTMGGFVRGGEILAPPSALHIFGTDELGRDVFVQTLHGLSVSVGDAIFATGVVLLLGGLAGFVFARLPHRSGYVVRGVAEILAAVPSLLLAAVGVSVFGHALAPLVAGIATSPLAFMRAFDRAHALSDSPHAEYARASGIPSLTLLRRDLVHEIRDAFLSTAGRALAAVTITLATLSFLGFGAAAPRRDLGLVIAASVLPEPVYLSAWWTVFFPALTLLLIVLFARLAAVLEEGERP